MSAALITGEVLTEADARRITDQILDHAVAMETLVAQAFHGQIWVALGYRDWHEYCDEELAALRVHPDHRPQLVHWLRCAGLSQRAIASVAGVSQSTIKDDLHKVSGNHSPENEATIFDFPDRVTGLDGKQHPATKPDRPARRQTDAPVRGDCQWFTPVLVIKPVHNVLGAIDLDPSSCDPANEVVGAATIFTAEEDGLTRPWFGRVFMNPPYTHTEPFCRKLAKEYAAGNVSAAIALTSNGTDTSWWQDLANIAAAICFPRGRVKFRNPNRSDTNGPSNGQSLFYLGADVDIFVCEFSPMGFTKPLASEVSSRR